MNGKGGTSGADGGALRLISSTPCAKRLIGSIALIGSIGLNQ